MDFTVCLAFVVTLIFSGSCEQSQQPGSVQLDNVHEWVPLKVRRTYRTVNTLPVTTGTSGTGVSDNLPLASLTTPEYPVQLRPRVPRWQNYATNRLSVYPSGSNSRRTFRRYRSDLPTATNNYNPDEVENIVQQPSTVSQQAGRLRFLGWLFGRPALSPYPDYSVLEQAAGLPYASRRPSIEYARPHYPVEYARPHPPVLIEECVELLDPYTDHVIEECQDVPAYNHY